MDFVSLLSGMLMSFSAASTVDIGVDSLECMTLNIFHEARSEPLECKIAIANVVMNRKADKRFPDTICGVVKQRRSKRLHRCAFSWFCDGIGDYKAIIDDGKINEIELDAYIRSAFIAIYALNGKFKDYSKGATHYFNPKKANPRWQHIYEPVTSCGNHVFYKRQPGNPL